MESAKGNGQSECAKKFEELFNSEDEENIDI